jgi:hypothetical protein
MVFLWPSCSHGEVQAYFLALQEAWIHDGGARLNLLDVQKKKAAGCTPTADW